MTARDIKGRMNPNLDPGVLYVSTRSSNGDVLWKPHEYSHALYILWCQTFILSAEWIMGASVNCYLLALVL